MVENRIISENKSNFDEKGFLNYDYLKNYFDCKRETHWGEFKGEAGRYIIDETNNKLYADVEIISSQIYNKLGIKTPVPLVVAKKEDGFKRFFIVKNSLSTDDKSYLNSRFGHFSKMKNVFKEDLYIQYKRLISMKSLIVPTSKKDLSSADIVMLTLAETQINAGESLQEVKRMLYDKINAIPEGVLSKADKDSRKRQIKALLEKLQESPESEWDLSGKLEEALRTG